jgi:membrane protease YdiL (CAAX protease family)
MRRIRLRRIVLFICLTFVLSWGFDLLLVARTRSDAFSALGMTPWGMFVPAFVALVLQLFVFRDSAIYFRRYRERPRWILLGFLLLTPVYAMVIVLALTAPGMDRICRGLGPVLITLWTLLVFLVKGQSDAAAFGRAGLGLGDFRQGPWFILGIIAFLIFQAVLNLATGLGDLQDQTGRIYGLPIPSGLHTIVLVALFFPVTVIGIPLSGLAAVFGEEYGWRGFLQQELLPLGKVRGVLLVGFVWGLWHFPVILRGLHTYPATSLGLALGLVFFVLWGFVQSYAVLRTGSIWTAAFLHGVVNSVYAFLLTYAVRPHDKVFSFGLGVYGLICLAVVVAVILQDPLWRTPRPVAILEVPGQTLEE